jgi:hypothetical protein
MQNSKSTIAILAAIVMIATTTTVLNIRLPSQQAYASQCNTFACSQLGCYMSKKTGRIYFSLSFTSKRIANELLKYGIVPQKTFTVKVKGELENNKHTWRGIIDGDGHLGIYLRKTPIGICRAIPYISLTGSLQVCLQFKTFLENTLGLSMPNIVSSKKSYSLSISDHRALRTIKLLYESCTMALERKLATARKIMNSFEMSDNSRYIKRRIAQ